MKIGQSAFDPNEADKLMASVGKLTEEQSRNGLVLTLSSGVVIKLRGITQAQLDEAARRSRERGQ